MLPAGTLMGILRHCGRTLVRRPHFQATRSAGARIAYMCRGTWLRWSAVGADTAVAMVTPRITRHNWPQPVPVPVPRQRRRRRSFGIRAAAAPGSASQAGGRSVPLCPGRARAGSPPPCSPCTVTATRVRDARVCWRACLHEFRQTGTDYHRLQDKKVGAEREFWSGMFKCGLKQSAAPIRTSTALYRASLAVIKHDTEPRRARAVANEDRQRQSAKCWA